MKQAQFTIDVIISDVSRTAVVSMVDGMVKKGVYF